MPSWPNLDANPQSEKPIIVGHIAIVVEQPLRLTLIVDRCELWLVTQPRVFEVLSGAYSSIVSALSLLILFISILKCLKILLSDGRMLRSRSPQESRRKMSVIKHSKRVNSRMVGLDHKLCPPLYDTDTTVVVALRSYHEVSRIYKLST